MEVAAASTPAPTTTATIAVVNNNNSPSPKSPEPESETPTRIQPAKPLSFTNGFLKRRPIRPPATAVSYKECLKNHAASLGGHALDGCGEFMPSPNSTHTDPTSLKCAACGCHRNFHRCDPEDSHHHSPNTPNNQILALPPPLASIEYQPHHRHHPPPPQAAAAAALSPNSASPPPISSSYYPSAPHMLLALSGSGLPGGDNPNPNLQTVSPHHQGSSSRKRSRSKFTQHQKNRMYEFAERLGWKLQKRDDDLVLEFCNEVKVDKSVLKVWMHNNKNTFGKIRAGSSNTNPLSDHHHDAAAGGVSNTNNGDGSNHSNHHHHHHRLFESDNVGANGSSSSS